MSPSFIRIKKNSKAEPNKRKRIKESCRSYVKLVLCRMTQVPRGFSKSLTETCNCDALPARLTLICDAN